MHLLLLAHGNSFRFVGACTRTIVIIIKRICAVLAKRTAIGQMTLSKCVTLPMTTKPIGNDVHDVKREDDGHFPIAGFCLAPSPVGIAKKNESHEESPRDVPKPSFKTWKPVYLLLLDTAEFPTVSSLIFQMRTLKDSAPFDATLLLMINFVHATATSDMETRTKAVWTRFFHKLNEQSADVQGGTWRTLALAEEGMAVVTLRGDGESIRTNSMHVCEPPPPCGHVDFGTVMIYLELHLKGVRNRSRRIGVVWSPTVQNKGPLAEKGGVLSPIQLHAAASIALSFAALRFEYADVLDDDHGLPPDAVRTACSNMVASVDGLLSLIHVRDTPVSPFSQHIWHASGKFRVHEGKVTQGIFEPHTGNIPIRSLPCCYKLQGRLRSGSFPPGNRLCDTGETWLSVPRETRNQPKALLVNIAQHSQTLCVPLSANTLDEVDGDTEALCVICWDKEANIVAIECGHLVFCGLCRIKSCKAKDAYNHNDAEFHPKSRKTKKGYDAIVIDCPICRRESKTIHKDKHSGLLYEP